MQVNTIIFPTDFSACSSNALKYALTIAETFYSKIVLVHVILYKSSSERPENIQNIKKSMGEKLNDLKLECLQKNPLLNITTVVTEGESAAPIIKLIDEENVDLIVLGAKGEGGIKDITIGSFATQIIDDASCPVLAIPERTGGIKFEKIVYASDLEHIDVAAIKQLTAFATFYNSEVTILNISDQKRKFSEDQLFKFEKIVRETCAYPKLDFIYFHGIDINVHIQEYLTRNKADLFVITTISESIVSNLFKDKNTKKMAYHATIPLLVFHETDKCCQPMGRLSF